MKILVINGGSSSLKYQLIDMDNESMVCKGNCERIGMPGGIFTHKTADGRELHKNVNMLDHTAAFMQVKNALMDQEYGVIQSLDEVAAVGHRIVQGGAIFHESVLVTEKVIEDIESLIPLAPLHNKAHSQGIRACREVFGESVPEVVVFTGTPEQMMWLCMSMSYYTGHRFDFHASGYNSMCVEAVLYPLMEQEPNITFGCYGCRAATDVGEDMMFMGVPTDKLPVVVEGCTELAKKAIPHSRMKIYVPPIM